MRQLQRSWISECIRYVKEAIVADHQPPENFIFWSAATAIGASLKRHVFYDKGTYKLFPNMYNVLVAAPGTGKGAAINPVFDILAEANSANVLSGRLTIEFILEKLSKGFATTTITQGQLSLSKETSAIIVSPEMSTMFRKNSDALADLNDLWDSREQPFPYGTRTKGQFVISKACQSMLAGTAPAYLCKSIPNDAVGGGFTRRCNFVHAKSTGAWIPRITTRNGNLPALRAALVDDLRYMSAKLGGEFKLEPAVEHDYDNYASTLKADEFSDDASQNYTTTKPAHAIKLAMVLSASREDALVIRKADWDIAKAAVEEVAATLPMVFRAVGESDLAGASDRVLRFLEVKGYASLKAILHYNSRHISYEDLQRVLETLKVGGIIMEKSIGNNIVYQIIPKTPGGGP